uniref:MYND-type domain-containing protein n=1 Tax=Parascaris univalens TaxID=6257 RepID=A0A915AEQ8_PARUN
ARAESRTHLARFGTSSSSEIASLNTMNPLTSVFERIRQFDNPFAHICMNNKVDEFCSNCLRIPKTKKLLKCASCEFARYCDKVCQRIAWKHHKNECRRLKAVFPNLPLTEVLFMSRIIDRVLFLEANGDKYGWERDRKWSDLLGHEEDIKADQAKYEHFEKIFNKMSTFRKDEMIDRDKFYIIFCKTSINSHSIHTSAGTEVGMALDLGVSAYDHSCRPNCSLVFDGYQACLRPLTPQTNASNPRTSFISYIDIGRSRYQRRKELKSKWYFDCACERCCDPADNILTSIRCSNASCDEPLITAEDAEAMAITCPKCGQVADEEYVCAAQQMMLRLPAKFSPESNPDSLQELLDEASNVLHQKNIYITRLQAAIMHITGTLKDNLPFIQRQVYENYKMCFPYADRHIGYQLLQIVRTYIEKGQRKEAISYAFEAMNIFEICFGLQHPYYLQTLALWTFLDTNAPKTDEELFALINFHSNRPVDLSNILSDVTQKLIG